MKTYILEREQIIPRPRAEVFAFFSDAFNLERITPAFLKFRIATPRPIRMSEGTVIDYKLSLYGVAFKWRTVIETWEPELGFLTDHNYHFPPHALLDTAVRYVWLGGEPPASQYDLSAVSPPYLIVGPFAKYTGLYTDQLSPDYQLVQSFGDYDVYARTASTP